MKIPRLPDKITALAPKLIRLRMLPIALVLLLIITVLAVRTNPASDDATIEAYRKLLQSQVENESGEPRTGRDPASQPQSSLAAAASSPTNTGHSTENPASAVQGDQSHHHTSQDIYGNPEKTGLNSSGCYYEYGEPGQCVPAHAATNGVLTCEGVTSHGGFPNGVTYTKDRFGLDKNHNGTACDPGD